ncbi:unnamed protein product [Acanthosepion pharaonis]|uniref:small monomeric GTPase n=1 Tax=Acanthosepion pharaonis TaxID=158019 RepID=A0A812EA58_ACAPH|nr:unnamed protein product [Sepia pharaonis]
MLVYSVTSRTSFDILLEIRRKIEDVKKVAHVPVIVVGNKADMAHVRQVTQDQGRLLAIDFGCPFMERSLVCCNIDLTQLESCARDRVGWRSICVAGVTHFVEERRGALEVRRRQRHLQPANSAPGMFTCHLCSRTCRSRIELLSHLTAHRRWTEMDGQRRRQQ